MAEERARYLAYYDGSKGIPNRTQFCDFLSHALAEAKKHQQIKFLVFLDLDRFKITNDSLGHRIGNLLLERVAGRLKNVSGEVTTSLVWEVMSSPFFFRTS